SMKTSPAPPIARLPRWTRCQSLANPSTLEYWHIGETATRLRNVTLRMVSGENRRGLSGMLPSSPGEAKNWRRARVHRDDDIERSGEACGKDSIDLIDADQARRHT